MNFYESKLLGLQHTADIYIYSSVQDVSGAVSKDWSYLKTVKCMVRTYAGKSGTSHGQEYDFNNQLSTLEAVVRIRTLEPIGTEVRLTNLRDINGVAMFPDTEDAFGVDGIDGQLIWMPSNSTPIVDHTGRVIVFETHCRLSEVQGLGGV